MATPILDFGMCIHMADAGGLDPFQLLLLSQESELLRSSLRSLLSRIPELTPLRQTIEALQMTKHGRALFASLSDALKTSPNIDDPTSFALKHAFSHVTPPVGDDESAASFVLDDKSASVVLVFLLTHANPSIVAHMLFFINCGDCPLKQFPRLEGKSMPEYVSDLFLSRLDYGSNLRTLAEYTSDPPPMKRKFDADANAAPKPKRPTVCIDTSDALNATFTEPTAEYLYEMFNRLHDERHKGDLKVRLKDGVIFSSHFFILNFSCDGLDKYEYKGEGEHGLNLSHIDAGLFDFFLRIVYGADPGHLDLLHNMLPGLFDIALDLKAPAILKLLVHWAHDSLNAFNDNGDKPIGIEHLNNADICNVLLLWLEAHKLCQSLENEPLPDDRCTSPAYVLQLSASRLLKSYSDSCSRNGSSRLKNLMSEMGLTPDHRRTLIDEWLPNGVVDTHLLFA